MAKTVSTKNNISSAQPNASVIVHIYSPEFKFGKIVPVDDAVSFQRYVYGPVPPITLDIIICPSLIP